MPAKEAAVNNSEKQRRASEKATRNHLNNLPAPQDMKLITLSIIILLLPLTTANLQGTLTIEHNNSGRISTASVNLSIPLEWTGDEPQTTVDNCTNMTITGLPLINPSGEQLSYSFTPWESGDSITYWIENAFGEIVKKAYTTTSKAKKSYTPDTTSPEQALIFKAVRERDGCEESEATAIVIITNEEASTTTCNETATRISDEEPAIASLYVRASKYQEHINLYGNAHQAGTYILFGEETPRQVTLPTGTFSLDITPQPGNNTYGIAPDNKSILATFTLSSDEQEQSIATDNSTSATANASIAGDYVFNPATEHNLTGMVILDNSQGNATPLLLLLVGLAGLSLLVAGKTKSLRSKKRSAKHHDRSHHQTQQERDQGKNRGRMDARFRALRARRQPERAHRADHAIIP